MIHSIRFTCVLDTNVIYPYNVRDLLLWLAYYDLYTPKWSKHIFDEWAEVMRRKNVPEPEIKRRIDAPNRAFPNALVQNYESLIAGLTLPDEKDKHVLAAAIKTNANIIVTNNIKDFPKDYLASFSLSVKTADDFIADTVDLNEEDAVKAFKEMASFRKKPPQTESQLLDMLENKGELKKSANYLRALL